MTKLPVLLLLVLPACLGAQTSVENVLDQVRSGVKPEQSMDYMRHVYSTDRWFTFPKFQETAEYLKRTLEGIGLERVEIVSVPADGKSQFGFWTMPMAWDAKSATLEIIGAEPVVLADFNKIPTSLGMW